MALGREMLPTLAYRTALLCMGLVSSAHTWNLPNTNYQGVSGGSYGGSWNHGQFGGHPSSVEQTASLGYGHNPWSGDGRALGAPSGAESVQSAGGYNGAVGGGVGGLQPGLGSNGGPNYGPGQGFGDGQFPTGVYNGGSNGASPAGSFGGDGSSSAGSFAGAGAGSGGSIGGPGSAPAGSFGGPGAGSAGSFGGPAGAYGGPGSTQGGSVGAPGAGSAGNVGGPAGSFGGPGSAPAAGLGGFLGGPPGSYGRPGAAPVGSSGASGAGPTGSFGDPAGSHGVTGLGAPGAGPVGAFGSAPAAGVGGSFGGAESVPNAGAVGAAGAGPYGSPGELGSGPVQRPTAGAGGPGYGNSVPSVPGAVFVARPAVAYYGHPAGGPSYPWGHRTPVGYGGYGSRRYPVHGGGYVYRVPVGHINPDGSYGFHYQTTHSNREEAGDSEGNVEGNYAFHNDGGKHNFSFSAGPDVDLRTGVGQRAGELDPADYGPQSVHSRARLPLVPKTDANDENNFVHGENGPRGQGTGASSPSDPNDSALSVLGLPKQPSAAGGPTSRNQQGYPGTSEPNSSSNPNSGNQPGVVRNTATASPTGTTNDRTSSTGVDGDGLATDENVEDATDSFNNVRGSFPNNGEAGPVGVTAGTRPTAGGFAGPSTTPRPQQSSVEQVGSRPENDPSYNFAYQTPTATRQESADRDGNVRGSFAYNNEAGRNDLQYVAGPGTGFRPTGGSLSMPNGLGGGAAGGTQGAAGGQPAPSSGFGGAGTDRRYQFGYRAPDSEREESSDGAGNVRGSFAYNNEAGRNDLQYVAGAGTGFRPTGGSLSVPNGLGGSGVGGGFESGSVPRFGGAPGAGSFGVDRRQPSSFNNRGGLGEQSFLSGGANANQGSGGFTTHNTVTRSPQEVPSGGGTGNNYEGSRDGYQYAGNQPPVQPRPGTGISLPQLPPGRWNTGNGNGGFATTRGTLSPASPSTARDGADESTTVNFDDSQQTTTFRGFGTGNGARSSEGYF